MYCSKCGFNFEELNDTEHLNEGDQTIITNDDKTENIINQPIESEDNIEQKKVQNVKLASLIQVFFGSFGLGHFYLKNYFRGFIHLTITLVALTCIYIGYISDTYTLSYSDGFPGVITESIHPHGGTFVFGVISLIINVIWGFLSGCMFFLENSVSRSPSVFIRIPLALLLFFGAYGAITDFKEQNIIRNGLTIEKDLSYYHFELDMHLGLSTVTIDITPDYDSYNVILNIDLKNSKGEIVTSYEIKEEKMTSGVNYQYKYSLSFSNISSIDKYYWKASGETYFTYFPVKNEKNLKTYG